jgi:SPP1 family predicted phage head-tail adaptor
MLRITSGKLNRQGVLQSETVTRGASGQALSTWSNVATVWFAMLDQSGREVVTAREVLPEMTHTLMIRYRAGVTGKLRFVYGARIFDVLAVRNPEEANEMLLLDCKEGRSQGS